LSAEPAYKFRIAGKISYLALVENEFDWFVFRRLAARKVVGSDEVKIDKVHPIAHSSGYDATGEKFGGNKVSWVENFKHVNNLDHITQQIFMICDRDELPLGDFTRNGVLVSRTNNRQNRINLVPGNQRQAHLLSWKRREIENYLLSFNLLEGKGVLEMINQQLPIVSPITAGNPNDNEEVRKKNVKEFLQPLYKRDDVQEIGTDERGVDFDKVAALIDLIPAEEISEDIENMYNYLVNKIQ